MVDHEPRFTNDVDCGPISLVILFDIFNKLAKYSKILVKTIKAVIKNINRYTVHESGCNIIRELIIKDPIFYNRPQEIIDEKEYMPMTDRNDNYIKLQTQSTKLCYDLLSLSNGCFERCLKKYCPCNCYAEMIMMACLCQQRHHLQCLVKYEVPQCFK